LLGGPGGLCRLHDAKESSHVLIRGFYWLPCLKAGLSPFHIRRKRLNAKVSTHRRSDIPYQLPDLEVVSLLFRVRWLQRRIVMSNHLPSCGLYQPLRSEEVLRLPLVQFVQPDAVASNRHVSGQSRTEVVSSESNSTAPELAEAVCMRTTHCSSAAYVGNGKSFGMYFGSI
jgi:hypothetical protein